MPSSWARLEIATGKLGSAETPNSFYNELDHGWGSILSIPMHTYNHTILLEDAYGTMSRNTLWKNVAKRLYHENLFWISCATVLPAGNLEITDHQAQFSGGTHRESRTIQKTHSWIIRNLKSYHDKRPMSWDTTEAQYCTQQTTLLPFKKKLTPFEFYLNFWLNFPEGSLKRSRCRKATVLSGQILSKPTLGPRLPRCTKKWPLDVVMKGPNPVKTQRIKIL